MQQGFHVKASETEWLKQHKVIFLHFGGQKVSSFCPEAMLLGLSMAILLVFSNCILISY